MLGIHRDEVTKRLRRPRREIKTSWAVLRPHVFKFHVWNPRLWGRVEGASSRRGLVWAPALFFTLISAALRDLLSKFLHHMTYEYPARTNPSSAFKGRG